MGKKQSAAAAAAAENIKVLVRSRPLSEKEKANGHTNCVDLDLAAHTIAVKSATGEPDRWTFDAVINNTFSQNDIFMQFIMPLVDSVLEGFNATVFAYGQSGSGKTYTMTGVMGDEALEGVIPRCFKHIFSSIKESKEAGDNKTYNMSVSFVELYNGKVRDLLAKQQVPLDVRESKDHTFFVQGAQVVHVKAHEDISRLMEEGTERRRTGSTELNADSSRSHSLFTLILERSETLEDGSPTVVTSKLNLVDLAGSERQGKTGASGDTLKEGCNINLSLSALGTVIDTIVKGNPHIPFRSSPLTMLLKDSLGGNSKTVMFANINPSERNMSETISTLRFADRAKQIKNKPVLNMDTKDQKISELSQMINDLREKLKKYETEGVADLEAEVERWRQRASDLEVELDGMRKSHETDDVDFQNAQAKFTAEKEELTKKISEMEEQLAQLRENLQIAELTAKNERLQRDEVFQICTKYLNPVGKLISSDGQESTSEENTAAEDKGNENNANAKKQKTSDTKVTSTGGLAVIDNVDELTKMLKNSCHNDNEEGALLRTQVETLSAANTGLKKELEVLQREMETKLREANAALEKSERKLKRAKKELQEATASGVEESSTTTTTPRAQVGTPRMQKCQSRSVDSSFFDKLDEQVKGLAKQNEKLMSGTAKELSQLKQMASMSSESDDKKLQMLRTCVIEGDNQFKRYMKIISGLFQTLQTTSAGLRQTFGIEIPFMDKVIDFANDIGSKAGESFEQVVRLLFSDMSKVAGHRNTLLNIMANSDSNTTADINAELKQVITENEAVHNKCTSLLSEKAELMTKERRVSAAKSESKSLASAYPQQFLPSVQQDGEKRKRMDSLKREEKESLAIRQLSDEVDQLRAQLRQNKTARVVLQSDADSLQSELAEQSERIASLTEARDMLYRELSAQRRENTAIAEEAAMLRGKLNELQCKYKRDVVETQGSSEAVSELESRLKERNKQLRHMRELVDSQKRLIVKSNDKTTDLFKKLQEAQTVAVKAEEEYRRRLEEKDANMQHRINERIAEYMESRKAETKIRDSTAKKLKKKLKKLQDWLEDLERAYDRKVCECEDLRQSLGDQKFERLKQTYQSDEREGFELKARREYIRGSLQRLKDDRRRRDDLFDLGEVPNIKRTASRGGMSTDSEVE